MKNDYGKSLADIREVLRREPRHFGALSGLGLILQEMGDDKRALEVYRRALDGASENQNASPTREDIAAKRSKAAISEPDAAVDR